MSLSPITRRRLATFRANRRGYYSALLLLGLFTLSLCAELLANDKPLLVYYKGQLLVPIVQRYIEKDTFGGALESEADYADPFIKNEIRAHGWMLAAPIAFHHRSINFATPRAPAPPSAANFFGTDDQARDVLARVIYGFRLSMIFAILLVAGSSLVGITIGALSGYFGGALDLLLQRFIEIWEGIPLLFLLIILSSMVVPNFWWVLGLMLLFRWMALVDVVRAEFLRARNFDYVRAARALGLPELTILIRHVLPNALVSVFTFLPFLITGAIATLASLDFLGFGLPSGAPSLGELLAQGKNNPQAPWLGLIGFFTLALMLSLWLFIGEAVRDAFNPRKIFVRGAA
ncbi:MAG: ABC transporter permease [Alphaproteobacteria bacterium]|nr:ABC transporter permease [Alphaproteobacteria bacterium]